jgi:hypothetical protein
VVAAAMEDWLVTSSWRARASPSNGHRGLLPALEEEWLAVRWEFPKVREGVSLVSQDLVIALTGYWSSIGLTPVAAEATGVAGPRSVHCLPASLANPM